MTLKKIDILLIACSEFSIISDLVRQKFAIPVLDTLDLLANKIIRFSKQEVKHANKFISTKSRNVSGSVFHHFKRQLVICVPAVAE